MLNDNQYLAAGNGAEVNPADAYAWSGWNDDEGERQVTKKGVPAFPLYVLHVDKAELRYTTGAAKMPLAAITATVKEGPTETIGRKVFFDSFLDISLNTVAEDGQTKVPKTQAELDKGYANLNENFNRIARVGKFVSKRPLSKSKIHLEQYCNQFGSVGGFDCIADVRVDKNSGRNSVWLKSLAALDDPADDKKLRAQGRTAIEEARIEIEKVNAIASKQPAGRTAGSLKREGLNA